MKPRPDGSGEQPRTTLRPPHDRVLVRRLVAPDDRVAVEAGDRIVFRTYSSSEVSSTAMNTSAMGEEDVRGVLGA